MFHSYTHTKVYFGIIIKGLTKMCLPCSCIKIQNVKYAVNELKLHTLLFKCKQSNLYWIKIYYISLAAICVAGVNCWTRTQNDSDENSLIEKKRV